MKTKTKRSVRMWLCVSVEESSVAGHSTVPHVTSAERLSAAVTDNDDDLSLGAEGSYRHVYSPDKTVRQTEDQIVYSCTTQGKNSRQTVTCSHQSINQSIKIYFLTPTRMVLLFCCRFTHVVLKIRPLHECDNDDDGDDSGCRSVSLGSSVTNVMGCVELCCVVLSWVWEIGPMYKSDLPLCWRHLRASTAEISERKWLSLRWLVCVVSFRGSSVENQLDLLQCNVGWYNRYTAIKEHKHKCVFIRSIQCRM